MLRTDGDYTIYVLQHLYESKGEWAQSGDASGFLANIPAKDRHLTSDAGQYAGSKYPFNHFTASNDVWQKTGIMGTFSKKAAEDFMVEVAKANPKHTFRVAKITISQTTEQVAMVRYT